MVSRHLTDIVGYVSDNWRSRRSDGHNRGICTALFQDDDKRALYVDPTQ